MARTYQLRVFKSAPGLGVYGAKVHVGFLHNLCRIAERLFSPDARCCAIAPGKYDIGGGLAELEVKR